MHLPACPALCHTRGVRSSKSRIWRAAALDGAEQTCRVTGEMEPETVRQQGRILVLERQAAVDRDEIAQLHAALATSRSIGAAVGIVMAFRRVTQDEAFQILSRASQASHVKLRDLALDVVATGALDAFNR
jgi:hypothetical protein